MPIVKSGDTLSAIALRGGVSLKALLAANPQIKNPDLIHPGEVVNLPGKTDEFKPGPASSPSSGGQSYRIRPGDTLSAIGVKFGVSWSAIAKANGIANPNLIRAGATLTIPGGSFTSPTKPPVNISPSPSGHGKGSAAFDVARSVLGQNIEQLKYSGPLSSLLHSWVSNHVCCANFVSACLEKAGLISHGEHNDAVRYLASNLAHDPQWGQTSLANAKPGDVVCFNVPGEGPFSHVEMFAGWQNGKPLFIGSNNVNADGSQRVSEGYAGYPIAAIYSYHG